jgi:hypothetical protein
MTGRRPDAVLAQRLGAPPAAVWARVCDSGFVAALLGARLPAAVLRPGLCLSGCDAQGRPAQLTVTAASAPHDLAVHWQAGTAPAQALRLVIAAGGGGSRLTMWQSLAEAAAADATGDVPSPEPDTAALARLLARPLPAVLQAGPPADMAAVQLACQHLADAATAVAQLCRLMAPRQGYRRPADGGFSLAEQVWHLADLEALGWRPRFAQLLDTPRPVLPGIDGDALAVAGRYQQRPWRGAARRFIAERARTLALLARCDTAVLARPVRFAGVPATGFDLLAALLAHDQEHRDAMAQQWHALASEPATLSTTQEP